jgi:hypothetical protein
MGGNSKKSPFWKDPLGSISRGIGKTIEAVAKNPLPVIETIAITYLMDGMNLGLSVAQSTAVSSAAVSAANGGNMKDIATAAASGYVGGTAAEYAGAGTKVPTETTKIASSAAGASASTVTSQLAQGKSLDEALQAGVTSGALAGATTGVIEETKAALAPPETGQGIKVVPGASSQLLDKTTLPLGEPGITAPSLLGDQTSVSSLGLTDKVPTGGGQGLTVDPATVLFSSQFAPSTGKVRGTEEGGLQPAYKSASDYYLTPPSFDTSVAPPTPYQEPKTVTQTPEPVISKTTESLARPIVSGALSEVFGLGPKIPGAPSAGGSAPVTQGTATGTTVGLTGERGAGEIEGKETGQTRKNVWNEASLRLKDALGV